MMLIQVDITNEGIDYIASCARIRQVTVSRLLNRVLATVCQDQLVLAVLDDDSKPCRAKGQHRYHARHKKLLEHG